ncbi:MAG TPA: prolyl oligopeptidase family serine peptidase, partial [Acidisarcina sp.]
MKMRRLGDISVSPDGKWVLYSATDVDLEKNTKTSHLFVIPAAGGTSKAVTDSPAGESRGRFSPDGKQVLFQSARGGGQQIYLAAFDGDAGSLGEARQLTTISTEADGAMWSPDGQSVLFTSAVYPDCPPGDDACNKQRDDAAAQSKVKAKIFTHLLYRHWNAYTGDKRSHLFLVPVAGGAPRDLNPGDDHDIPPFSLGGPDAYAFSPDSKEIAFEENLDAVGATSTHVDIFTLRLDDPAAKPIKISSSLGGNFSPAYSPDGKSIAWRSQARAGYESDKFRLVIYDRKSKQINVMLPEWDRWIDEFVWDPGAPAFIFFTSGDKGEESIYHLYVTSRAGEPWHLVKITGAGEYGDMHPAGGYHIIASRMTVRQPTEIVSLDLSTVTHGSGAMWPPGVPNIRVVEMQLTHLNHALLSQLDLAPLEPFWFRSVGGVRVQGFVVKPPAFDAAKKYPVKFLIHGGPEGAWGDSWSYRWNPELFAASGYVVVMVNPRGSTGYGQAFTDGVNNDWGGK